MAQAKEYPDGSGEYPAPATLSPTSRRLLVRSVYAFIEAMAYRFKQDAVESDTTGLLSPEEQSLCVEETYELGVTGRVETKRAKLRTLSNLRFTFDVAARAHGASFVLDVSGPEWQALQDGLKVRDRLMHPKRLTDLDVTDDEIRRTMKGFHWIHHQFLGLLESQTEAAEKQLRDLRIEHQRLMEDGGSTDAV